MSKGESIRGLSQAPAISAKILFAQILHYWPVREGGKIIRLALSMKRTPLRIAIYLLQLVGIERYGLKMSKKLRCKIM